MAKLRDSFYAAYANFRAYLLLIVGCVCAVVGIVFRSNYTFESVQPGHTGFEKVAPNSSVIIELGPNDPDRFRHGDVVMYRNVNDPTKHLLGRVVGKPGDRITIKEGKLLRNGQPVTNCPKDTPQNELSALVVPRDTLYLIMDYGGANLDSRFFGPIPVWAVDGKAALVE